jgi:hypothetical protein
MGDASPLAITLRYRSQRREVWSFYWSRWRGGLWRNWLVMGTAAFVAALFIQGAQRPIDFSAYVTAGLIVLILFAALIAYPQLAYKPLERQLTVNAAGIDTTRGTRSDHRAWKDIAAITDAGSHIALVVAKTGNAFLVPNRAFADAEARRIFLHAATEWHGAR